MKPEEKIDKIDKIIQVYRMGVFEHIRAFNLILETLESKRSSPQGQNKTVVVCPECGVRSDAQIVDKETGQYVSPVVDHGSWFECKQCQWIWDKNE